MLLIAVVALLVVGPERMPEAVRSVALNVGRIKRMFNNARDEIEKQVGADEIRRQLHNETIMDNLAKIKEGVSDIDKSIDDEDTDMPWTEEEYEKIQRAHEEHPGDYVDSDNLSVGGDTTITKQGDVSNPEAAEVKKDAST